MNDFIPVLLAGGLGTRLWPLSREIYPKQLMNLAGEGSLLQQAARRALLGATGDRVITVTTEAHFFPVRDQLGAVDPALTEHILLEPMGRNTAAAVAVAALRARDIDPDGVLFVAPADHVVKDPAALAAAARVARAAAANRLVTFGIEATRPETGYGYIRTGEPLEGVAGANEVAQFIEKPDQETAERLIAGGDVLWNSGMFVFRAELLLDEMARHCADILDGARAAHATARNDSGAVRFDADAYQRIPAAPIDKAVMERSDKVAVVPVDPGWSDVGSWRRLWEVSDRDDDGNVAIGDVILSDSRNCLVRGESRLVACAGVENVVVTETADAVLVAGLDADAGIRDIVERLRVAGRPEAVRHLAEDRPWGSFRVLLEGPRFKIKEIVVKPGGILSLQSHRRRSEHWVVVDGSARVTRDDTVEMLGPNESSYIPIGARHRLENPGDTPLRIVEVQCGDYLGEDDIERYEDSYGRE